MIKKTTVLAVAIATGTFAGAVVAAPGASADPDHALPFRVTVSGTAVQTGLTTGTFAGSGNGEHMGAITNAGGVVAHIEAPSDQCPNGFLSTNTETFTAADGDRLSIISSDVTCPVGLNEYQGTGQWHVVPGSGTGHFEGADGRGTYAGIADFDPAVQTFSFTFTGTVTR